MGTFIIWKTKERLRSVRNIGDLDLPEPDKGDYVNFVLDGQQRITSLVAALKGETIKRSDGRDEDFSRIVIDLDAEENESVVKTYDDKSEQHTTIQLNTLLYGGSDCPDRI